MRIATAVAVVVLLSLAVFLAYSSLGPHGEKWEAEARRKLPFESLVERLPRGKSIPPTRPLSPEAKKRWKILDQELADTQDPRAKLLQELHEKASWFFIESPGAGPERRLATPEEMILYADGRAAGTVAQPGEPADFPLSPGEPLSLVEPNGELFGYHKDGMLDFLYPTGFGYVKDRTHVAGFRSHGFRSRGWTANESWRWRVQHVQLVGILSHEKPLVYLTDRLPGMEQIRRGKTRPLDGFEEAALSALREGEDLFIASKGETVRMLGALRATKTCLQCHDAEGGDLLGAFSYTLRRVPGVKQDE